MKEVMKKVTKEYLDEMLTRETEEFRRMADVVIDEIKEARDRGGFDEYEPQREIYHFEQLWKKSEHLACMVDTETFMEDIHRFCKYHNCDTCPLSRAYNNPNLCCDDGCRVARGELTWEDIEMVQTWTPKMDKRDRLIIELIEWVGDHIYKNENLIDVLKKHTSITEAQLEQFNVKEGDK